MSLASEASRQASFRWPGPPAVDQNANRWLTMENVCDVAQLSETTVKKYVAQGKLKAYRVGGSHHLRFRQADVDAIMVPVEPKDVVDPKDDEGAQCQNNSPSTT